MRVGQALQDFLGFYSEYLCVLDETLKFQCVYSVCVCVWTQTHYFAVLATDRNSSAREELYRTIACWLCELGERKEHESRLVP